jgi:hypothetical protein
LSATISLTSAQAYGVERVCAIWAQPRSSFYAWQRDNHPDGAERAAPISPVTPAQKRGPKTMLSDTELRYKIRADLARSPFQGEGHRKVWARLRVMDEVRASRKRILRIMRENQLLSPYRCRQATGEKHTGTKQPRIIQGTLDPGCRVGLAEGITAAPLLLRLRAAPNGRPAGLNTSKNRVGHLAP